MAEWDIPESWSLEKSKEPNLMARLSRIAPKGDATRDKHPGGNDKRSLFSTTSSNSSPVNRATDNHFVIDSQSDVTTSSEQVSGKPPRKLPRWARSWVLWAVIMAFAPGSIAFFAISMLLKLPSAPNCPSIFWPLASASVRVHCAQLAASKQNVKDLLQAISLVQHLPQSHPLRSEIDRLIEEWSKNVLELADLSFQDGKLEEAMATARKIPQDLGAYKLVDEKIEKWQSTWSKAEELYQKAEDEARNQRWQSAFITAAKLLRLDNKHWENTKYNQLNQLITKAREDGNKLAQAKFLAKRKNVDNLLKAIEVAEYIGKDSFVYAKAQELIPEIGQTMLDLAKSKLNRQDGDEAIRIAQDTPDSTGLTEEREDFIALAEAQNNAWLGTVSGLEVAISQAQQIEPSRPNYEQAQQLIARWQLEIEDVSRLDQARLLASRGTIGYLSAAIAQAQLIPVNNPRSSEARKEIGRWTTQIQTIEDRPILEQARSLASTGNLNDAIATANQISRGRSLSREARREISKWQEEINAKQNWRRARNIALRGTPQALARAIRLARSVPRRNALGIDANIAMDRWSQQLLDIARFQGQSDINQGIETANLVPRGTAAYNAAREQIRTWRQFLKPTPQETEEVIVPTEDITNSRESEASSSSNTEAQ